VPPWGGPEQVLKYLARYTHRVAIGNQRLVDLEDGKVRFHWKDYAHRGVTKTMTLLAVCVAKLIDVKFAIPERAL
jgi:Putative transposase